MPIYRINNYTLPSDQKSKQQQQQQTPKSDERYTKLSPTPSHVTPKNEESHSAKSLQTQLLQITNIPENNYDNEVSDLSSNGSNGLTMSLKATTVGVTRGRQLFDCDSFIVREFEEQQKREEELRQQRSRLSMTTSQTHYNVSNISSSSSSNDVNSLSLDLSKLVDEPGHVWAHQHQQPKEIKPVVRVQPYEEESDEDARYAYIKPNQETVIEREIRLIRQREGSLRRVRGYPALQPSRDKPIEIELTGFEPNASRYFSPSSSPRAQQSNGNSSGSGGLVDSDDVAMKRLATNRLRLEILRERQREVDLRDQGKISTISEERIGKPLMIIDLEHRTGKNHQVPDTRFSIDQKYMERQRQQASKSVSKAYRQVHFADVNDNEVMSHTLEPVVDQSQQQQQQQQQQQPQMLRNAGERLIAEEVEELRRREEELREQRKMLVPLTNGKQTTRASYVRV